MSLPPFTPAHGGFVTAVQLADGRFLVEGWILNVTPSDGAETRHEPNYHFLTQSNVEAANTIMEFVLWLDKPIDPGTP